MRRAVVLLPAVASACVLWFPRDGGTPHGLQEMHRARAPAAALAPGTSREDVLFALGLPDRVLDDGRALLWVGRSVEGLLVIAVGNSAGVQVPLGHDYVLLVEFVGDRVHGHRFAAPRLGGWPQQVRDWCTPAPVAGAEAGTAREGGR